MRKLLLIPLVILLFISLTSAYWNTSMSNGLVAAWNMNQSSSTQTDLRYGTYNITGGASSSVECGILNKCVNISIDAVSNYSYQQTDSPMTNPNVTITIWFNSSDNVTAHDITLWSDTAGENRLQYLTQSGGRLLVTLGNTNVINNVGNVNVLFEQNKFTMITLTYDDSANIARVYINNTLVNESSTAFSVGASQFFIIGGAGGRYFQGMFSDVKVWNKTLSLNEITAQYNSGNGEEYNIFAPSNYITATLNSPEDNNQASSSTIRFNASYTAYDMNITNTTLYIWNNTNNIFATNTTWINGTSNVSSLTISNIPFLSGYKWYQYVCGNNGTANLCFYSSNRSFSLNLFNLNNSHYALSVYETANSFFEQNITLNSGYTLTSATLYYDGTSYSSTKTCTAVSCNLQNNIDIHTVTAASQNKSFYYSYIFTDGITNTLQTSNVTNQTVNEINFSLCAASPLNTSYLNISFKDESTNLFINASIVSSSFIYRLGNGGANKTYTYSTNNNNYSYLFCANPIQTFKIDPTISYKQGTAYLQRTWNPSVASYTSSLTNHILYLLSSGEGNYFNMVTIDSSGNAIANVEVNAYSVIDGVSTLVSSGTTDSTGLITMWLNFNNLHTITFTKSGYSTTSISKYPANTGTPEYITMSSESAVSGDINYAYGITNIVRPQSDYLNNNTQYSFNYSFLSTYYSETTFGFILKYENGTVITSTSNSGQGTLNYNFNVGSNNKIVMEYFYTVNNTYTNFTRYWLITTSNRFSLANFFSQLTGYINSDIFGLLGDDNGVFSKALIAVVILISTVGILSYKFGFANDAVLMGLIFGVTLFLNTLGFIPNNLGFQNVARISLGNFIVFITAVLTFAFIVKEGYR